MHQLLRSTRYSHQIHSLNVPLSSNIQASHMLGGERVVLGGWYDTHLVRQARGWRIARSQLNITWREGREELFAEAAARTSAPNDGNP